MSIEAAFGGFSASLEEEQKFREEVKKISKELEAQTRSLQAVLQTIHLRGADILTFVTSSYFTLCKEKWNFFKTLNKT